MSNLIPITIRRSISVVTLVVATYIRITLFLSTFGIYPVRKFKLGMHHLLRTQGLSPPRLSLQVYSCLLRANKYFAQDPCRNMNRS